MSLPALKIAYTSVYASGAMGAIVFLQSVPEIPDGQGGSTTVLGAALLALAWLAKYLLKRHEKEIARAEARVEKAEAEKKEAQQLAMEWQGWALLLARHVPPTVVIPDPPGRPMLPS